MTRYLGKNSPQLAVGNFNSVRTILLATTNQGKLNELELILVGSGIHVVSLDILPAYVPPIETGHTFEENARIKAQAVRRFFSSRMAVHLLPDLHTTAILADDSGLTCDDLGGLPGVASAYFAGPQATDVENNRKLQTEIARMAQPTRVARFVCVLVFMAPDGREHVVRETCEGRITSEPRGTNGFGYDPYFLIPETGLTLAEMSPEAKNAFSHRGRAMRALLRLIQV